MKALPLITGSVFISTFLCAQVTTPKFKNPLLKNYPVEMIAKTTQPKAKLITQSSLGKVYAMPLDNMPCLVPTAIESSVAGFVFPLPQSEMPNPIPKQDFFTSPTVNANLLKFNKTTKEPSKNLMLDLVRKK